MKKVNKKKTFKNFMMLMALLAMSACGSKKDTPEPDVQAMLISGTWKMQEVTVDGVNKNAQFSNLSILFTKIGFTSEGGAPVWPLSGTWIFADAEKKSITRNDGAIVMLRSISSSELTLALHWNQPTLGGGRTNSVQGDYVFVLDK
jgi:hypothetical protein